MSAEEKLARDLAQRKALQMSLMKAKLAKKKKDRLKKLRQEEESEKAKVRNQLINSFSFTKMEIKIILGNIMLYLV